MGVGLHLYKRFITVEVGEKCEWTIWEEVMICHKKIKVNDVNRFKLEKFILCLPNDTLSKNLPSHHLQRGVLTIDISKLK